MGLGKEKCWDVQITSAKGRDTAATSQRILTQTELK